MNPLAALRRFVPTLALVLATVTTAGALGIALGLRSWLLIVGASVIAGACAAVSHLAWIRRQAPPVPEKARPRMKGGPSAPITASYDLAQDQSTDNQRYLM